MFYEDMAPKCIILIIRDSKNIWFKKLHWKFLRFFFQNQRVSVYIKIRVFLHKNNWIILEDFFPSYSWPFFRRQLHTWPQRNLNKFKEAKSSQATFSDHNPIKSEIKNMTERLSVLGNEETLS